MQATHVWKANCNKAVRILGNPFKRKLCVILSNPKPIKYIQDAKVTWNQGDGCMKEKWKCRSNIKFSNFYSTKSNWITYLLEFLPNVLKLYEKSTSTHDVLFTVYYSPKNDLRSPNVLLSIGVQTSVLRSTSSAELQPVDVILGNCM